jgi:HSP20 family protein
MTTEVNKIKTDNYNHKERVIVPPVDIYETDNEYVIRADMPGVTRENLDITLDNDILAINGRVNEDEDGGSLKYGEYSLYNFSRSFNVGKDVDGTAVTASTEHGVLTLILPKKEKVKPKKISITTH